MSEDINLEVVVASALITSGVRGEVGVVKYFARELCYWNPFFEILHLPLDSLVPRPTPSF